MLLNSEYNSPHQFLSLKLIGTVATAMSDSRRFNKGDTVEIIGDGYLSRTSYFPATVLQPSARTKHNVYVEYQTLPAASDGSERLREHVDAGRVRPVPPPELDQSFNLCETVDAFHENGWRRGKIVGLFLNSKYLVLLEGTEEQIEFERINLRRHRDWDDGSWNPPLEEPTTSFESETNHRDLKFRIKCGGRALEANFYKGTMVEIRREEEGYQHSWYTAVIVDSIGSDKFLVEYKTLRTDDETELRKENVHASYVRPCPPELPKIAHFKEFQEVDAWHSDGWWLGHIVKVIDDYNYIVHLMSTNEEVSFEHFRLRPHQDWIDGKWVAPGKRSSGLELKSAERGVKLKIKFSGKTSEPKFTKGTMVEVKSDEEGYQGSWYTATVVGSVGKDKFLVEYQTLKTEDETELLKEKADASYIRPCPPVIQRMDRFKLFEKVDAWYNDGWWVGLVTSVLNDFKYAVYFWTTNEELEFGHFDLRPHQELIGGKWVADFRKKSSELPLKPRPGKLKRQNGLIIVEPHYFLTGVKVEVKSDEEGYLNSWYPAVIIGSERAGKYLVEYRTLKTDEGFELLKEEADVPCIRHSPPINQRADPFEPFEEVDAWYNDAWWVGSICRVLVGSNYAVYVRGTNEVLEFQHSELRPHQDWVDGKWVVPCRGRRL